MRSALSVRRFPIGAEAADAGTHFRIWAPKARRVAVVVDDGSGVPAGDRELEREEEGYFAGLLEGIGAATRYWVRLDERTRLLPDPASRFQPEGPHGPSQVVDPRAFRWRDQDWRGITLRGQVLYEMHVGTFTREGTWQAAARELGELKSLGVTVVEVMPVGDFPGRFGWGYDGVNLFAPTRLYGGPDDFRAFVDTAHSHGLAVILDVVYNHFGPDGNFITEFSDDYISPVENEWGRNINFDGKNSAPVREFFVANAGYWVDEFHLDGLRLDATQSIIDTSKEHVIAAIVRRAREAAAGRSIIVIAENERQDTILARDPSTGGYGADGLWNDDYHHSAIVALTGDNDAYYSDHHGTAQELLSALKWGYLFQGQWYGWQRHRRGTPAFDVAPSAFVLYTENHDQIANSSSGRRTHQLTSPGRYRAIVALTLLAPGTPMLFQGQEFAASSPFLFFADHQGELGAKVRAGRREFLSQFIAVRSRAVQERLPDPTDIATFERCKLDLAERQRNAGVYKMYRDLLALRRSDHPFKLQRPAALDGAILNERAFIMRLFGDTAEQDRLVIVNLGNTLKLPSIADPLVAPPPRGHWVTIWSSDSPAYGGGGVTEVETPEGWRIPAESTTVLG